VKLTLTQEELAILRRALEFLLAYQRSQNREEEGVAELLG
jgi:hypothetical protein